MQAINTAIRAGTVRAGAPADSRMLRRCLGSFPTGVAVVTALGDRGDPIGVTVNSFASVSLDPPLVLWSQAQNSPTHPSFLQAGAMIINILADDQADLSVQFSRPVPDRFHGVECVPGLAGVPMLQGCAATLQCSVADRYYGGDHIIFLCRVEHYQSHEKRPLIFSKGSYLKIPPESPPSH